MIFGNFFLSVQVYIAQKVQFYTHKVNIVYTCKIRNMFEKNGLFILPKITSIFEKVKFCRFQARTSFWSFYIVVLYLPVLTNRQFH